MTTPEPVDVTFTVDLSTVVGRHHRQISEDDYTTEDETLGDRIASLVAEKVYRAHKDVWASYERRQEVTEAVDRAIDARVSEALSRPITPTDQYGQPKGEPTTLGEIIDWRLAEWFKAAKADAGYQRQQVSNLDALIEKAVSEGIRKDVDGAVKAARAQIVATLQAEGVKVMTEMLARAVGVRP